MKTRKVKTIAYSVISVFFIVVVVGRLFSAIAHIGTFFETLKPMHSSPNASYSEKMSMKYPVYYNFIEKVKALTPEDGTVYIPSVEIPYSNMMWPIGSLQISSALLFPRKVSFYDVAYLEKPEKNTFIVIVNGNPKESITTKKIYIFGEDTMNETTDNYAPTNFNGSDIGLMQL
jgi:hypothetical protein